MSVVVEGSSRDMSAEWTNLMVPDKRHETVEVSRVESETSMSPGETWDQRSRYFIPSPDVLNPRESSDCKTLGR